MKRSLMLFLGFYTLFYSIYLHSEVQCSGLTQFKEKNCKAHKNWKLFQSISSFEEQPNLKSAFEKVNLSNTTYSSIRCTQPDLSKLEIFALVGKADPDLNSFLKKTKYSAQFIKVVKSENKLGKPQDNKINHFKVTNSYLCFAAKIRAHNQNLSIIQIITTYTEKNSDEVIAIVYEDGKVLGVSPSLTF